MVFEDFRREFYDLICFNRNQVLAWHPGFDKNNLGRWVKKGYIIKLRNGFYCFPEYISMPQIALYIANQIYKPSYISLHTVLSFYGLIPESVSQITSVSGMKTNNYQNSFGNFTYHQVHPDYYFGYEQKSMQDGRMIQMAYPEKAILDLFYLYPFYNSSEEMTEMRFDEDILGELIDVNRLMEYCDRFQNKALKKRVITFAKVYRL